MRNGPSLLRQCVKGGFLLFERICMKEIRKISAEHVANTVCALLLEANHQLPEDVLLSIKQAAALGNAPLEKSVLMKLIENAHAAREMGIPMCQDTGMAVVFADVGELIHIEGSTLEEAVNEGVRRAYVDGGLRLSVVNDPLFERKNTQTNTPAILHIRTVKGNKLHLTVAPKGFGSENMSRLQMFTPSATADDIVSFIVDGVQKAGSNPCPPIVVGVEITQKYDYRSYENKVINYISHDFGMTYFRENHGLLEYGDVIKAGYENNDDFSLKLQNISVLLFYVHLHYFHNLL